MRRLLLILLCLMAAPLTAAGCERGRTPRVAVISAFEPEWRALKAIVDRPASCRINGTEFVTGRIAGRRVVVFMSGVSMVNAAMTTQLALDHFSISQLVVSGVAGGVDPALGIGDVVAPDRWGEYLEVNLTRARGDGFEPAPFTHGAHFDSFGMMTPSNVIVGSAKVPTAPRFWFEVDPAMLAAARAAAQSVTLQTCGAAGACLDRSPRVVIGGAGVSGSAFVDNAAFREYAYATFQARVMDMETAAMAHVAFANDKPFIAFRSLSDLAGGGAAPNQIRTFMGLAATNSAELVRQFLKRLPPSRASR